jgi:tetratricopeptide (TPR) repeat protein
VYPQISRVLVLVLLAMVLATAHAKERATDQERLLLPPFCMAKAGKATKTENRHWLDTFGRDNWVSMHHYCTNIVGENRANMIVDLEMKTRGLRGARQGYQKHLAETTKDYILRPEIYYRIGSVSYRLGDTSTALDAYYKSIQLKPKYTRSYIGLSNIFRDMGQYKEALEIINKGLVVKPESRGLLRYKKKLEKELDKER